MSQPDQSESTPEYICSVCKKILSEHEEWICNFCMNYDSHAYKYAQKSELNNESDYD